MGKTGGIIGIIAGVLGVLAALFTLFVGGVGAAFSAGGAGTVVGLGWGGVLFSLLTIVYGGIALAKPKPAGAGLLLSALGGIVLGGTFVAVFMALALVGGGLAVLAPAATASGSTPPRRWPAMVGAAFVPFACMAVFGPAVFSANKTEGASVAAAETALLPLPLGATARGEQFEVALHDLRLQSTIGQGLWETRADPGTVFAVLRVTSRCVDRESRFYQPGDLFALVNGKEFRFDHAESVVGLDSPTGQINPMTEKSGFVVFKIPAELARGSLLWHPGRQAGLARFALSTPATSSIPAQIPQELTPAASPDDVGGVYSGPNGGELTIQRGGDGKLRFSLTAFSAPSSSGLPNTGSAEGGLTMAGGVGSYRDEAFDCTLEFAFSGSRVNIAQDGMCGFGTNVSAAGEYEKR